MKLLSDYHTHSNFSRFGHGKNSIEQMVMHANELGLEELAITDHGLKHFFRTSKEKLLRARKIIDDINTWSKTKVLLGIEADIINSNGELDIDDDVLGIIDVLAVGYHKMIKTDFAGYFGGQGRSQNAIDRATNAYLNAIERYPINFITHIDSILHTDLYKIGKACKEHDIAIEINDRHVHWTRKQAEELIRSDCMFIVNSDAHSRDGIGRADFAFKTIRDYKIPAFNIINVEFEESEMTAEDRELQEFLDVYKEKKDFVEQKYEKQIERQKTEFNNKLSKEMEDALRELSFEKGLDNNTTENFAVDDHVPTDDEILDEVSDLLYGKQVEPERPVIDEKQFQQEYDKFLNNSEKHREEIGVENNQEVAEKRAAQYEDFKEYKEIEELIFKNWRYKDTFNKYIIRDNIDLDSFTEEKFKQALIKYVINDGIVNLDWVEHGDIDWNEFDKLIGTKFIDAKDSNKPSAGVNGNSALNMASRPQAVNSKSGANFLNQVTYSSTETSTVQPQSGASQSGYEFSEQSLRNSSGASVKDSTYLATTSENQFNSLKDDAIKSQEKESDNDFDAFFGNEIDSSKFNVNQKRGANLSNARPVEKNFVGGGFAQGFGQGQAGGDNQRQAVRNNGANKGTFIGVSNNVSEVQKPVEKPEEPAEPAKKQGSRNGFVDLSSLTGDDD